MVISLSITSDFCFSSTPNLYVIPKHWVSAPLIYISHKMFGVQCCIWGGGGMYFGGAKNSFLINHSKCVISFIYDIFQIFIDCFTNALENTNRVYRFALLVYGHFDTLPWSLLYLKYFCQFQNFQIFYIYFQFLSRALLLGLILSQDPHFFLFTKIPRPQLFLGCPLLA